MSYVKHNFTTGQVLQAAQLNQMDDQIALNEAAAAAAQTAADSKVSSVNGKTGNVTLTADDVGVYAGFPNLVYEETLEENISSWSITLGTTYKHILMIMSNTTAISAAFSYGSVKRAGSDKAARSFGSFDGSKQKVLIELHCLDDGDLDGVVYGYNSAYNNTFYHIPRKEGTLAWDSKISLIQLSANNTTFKAGTNIKIWAR